MKRSKSVLSAKNLKSQRDKVLKIRDREKKKKADRDAQSEHVRDQNVPTSPKTPHKRNKSSVSPPSFHKR